MSATSGTNWRKGYFSGIVNNMRALRVPLRALCCTAHNVLWCRYRICLQCRLGCPSGRSNVQWHDACATKLIGFREHYGLNCWAIMISSSKQYIIFHSDNCLIYSFIGVGQITIVTFKDQSTSSLMLLFSVLAWASRYYHINRKRPDDENRAQMVFQLRT